MPSTAKKPKLLSFNQAVIAVQNADLVVLHDRAGGRAIATYLGWENECDDESDFIVGAEGWDDVYIPHDQKIEREGNVLKIPGYCVYIHLYPAKK
jgi:hypothetical protein